MDLAISGINRCGMSFPFQRHLNRIDTCPLSRDIPKYLKIDPVAEVGYDRLPVFETVPCYLRYHGTVFASNEEASSDLVNTSRRESDFHRNCYIQAYFTKSKAMVMHPTTDTTIISEHQMKNTLLISISCTVAAVSKNHPKKTKYTRNWDFQP